MSRKRYPIRELIIQLEKLNKESMIYSLSIQSSGTNTCTNYTHVSFKIPKKKENNDIKKINKKEV